MSESVFRNVATLVGQVVDKEYRDDIGSGLGKMNIDAGGNRVYVNIWNTKDNNVAEPFLNKYQEGDYIQVQGELEEQFYNNEYRRNIRAWVSNRDGVMRVQKASEDNKGKAVASLAGDVMDIDLRFRDDVVGMDLTEPIPVTDVRIAFFNTYNSDDRNTPLTRAEVLINEIKRYGDYAKLNEIPANFDNLTKWISTLEEDDSVKTVLDILSKFLNTSARMYNIKTYNCVAYKDVAEKLAEELLVGDNVTVGLFINNRLVEDEFGTIGDIVNELEIGKLNNVNERPESGTDNNDFNVW